MVPVTFDKINEIFKEINDKYTLKQTGAIREAIWTKPKAPVAEETKPIKSKIF